MRMNENGVSLLEVLVSLVVTSIGILGMAPMIALSVDGNNISKDMVTVSKLAKDKIEYFENLSSLPSLPFSETETNLSERFNRTVTIIDNSSDTTLGGDLYALDVRIYWVDKAGKNRSSSYHTYIKRNE